MIDFHTHILPNMDDGSVDVPTSIQLLNILKNDGVKLVYLTSHFYPRQESVDDFLSRRKLAYNSIKDKTDLDIRLGAEVHYYRGISNNEDLAKLCLENTNILLLELSFNIAINDLVVSELINLKNKGFTVVLAHIERYEISLDTLNFMHKNGILFQINTEFINDFFGSRKALNWLKLGIIDCIGSDCHNLANRVPNYKKAMDKIANKLGEEFITNFIAKTYKIIEKK